VRPLPARVAVYFVLALAFFERSSYTAVWGKLGAGLRGITPAVPAASPLSQARRRLGSAPLRCLFEVLSGPVATPVQRESFYCGLRVVAVDGTTLSIPDEQAVTWRYPKYGGPVLEFGYPLLRLVALVECGTRALLGAAFGPDATGELGYAEELIALYHHRWQVETCYFSLKSTILGGRVLRSRTIPGVEQEVYALLTVYQALARVASDLVTARPGLSAQRISLTVLLGAAADQIIAARGIGPGEPVALIGAIGRAALAGLLPKGKRWRLKARVRKRNSKYTFTADKHPRKAQAYALHIDVITEGDLDSPLKS